MAADAARGKPTGSAESGNSETAAIGHSSCGCTTGGGRWIGSDSLDLPPLRLAKPSGGGGCWVLGTHPEAA
jgi:hypothetical protein